jgi:hypothetical protein
MKQENQFSEKSLIALIRSDCLRQAKTAKTKLDDVIECLDDGRHLGALGSFAGLDEDIAHLKVFLTRIARLTVDHNDLIRKRNTHRHDHRESERTSRVQPKPKAKTTRRKV